jgi:hypothetical protein
VPTIRLASYSLGPVLPVIPPAGSAIDVPRVRFRCLVRIPQFLMPLDAIIDTGSPLTCFPRSIWDRFLEGIDFEWLPFATGVHPPPGQTVDWQFTFRMARFLVPLALMDYSTETDRAGVIAQFADNDPPGQRGRALPWFIIGLWGGVLEGGRLAIGRDPVGGQVTGGLDFP